MAQSLVGQTLLGKYRVDGIIGSGGMGTVYEANDLRLGRTVAIKVLSSTAQGFGDAGRRFRREARAIGKVTHPNLVTLLEYDLLDDGTPAMVLERVCGSDLRLLLAEHRFTVVEAHRLLWQCLAALAVCHDHGYVHRDLKPDNVLVESRDDGFHAKLIDFGLTKLVADEGSTALTLNGEVFGSPRFMAPEQWFQQAVDGRTDLYALGCIGYCMLLGQHFIPPGNPMSVCQAHLRVARPPLDRTPAGETIPGPLATALRRACEPDIELRWPDARAMINAMAGEPSAPLPPPPIEADELTDDTDDTDVITGGDLLASHFNAAVVASDRALFATTQPFIDETLLDGPGLAAQVRAATEPPSAPPPVAVAVATPTPQPPRNQLQAIPAAAVNRVLRATEERPPPARRDPRRTALDLDVTRAPSYQRGLPPWVVPTLTGAVVGGLILLWLLLTR